MPSLLTEDAFTSTAKISSTRSTTSRSLFALALRALSLCVFLVVVAAFLLLSPAAVVILLPVACMAASVCLLCATTARLLAPSSVAPGRARENRGGVRERNKQDCVEADRTEAPAGGFGDGGGASSAEEEHAEQEQDPSSFRFSPFDEELSDSWGDDDEQGRFFFVDTRSYCRTFYDLLAFWRSMERRATRVCWSIWKMRNMICFEGKKLNNPLEIISHSCALMKFWAGLLKDLDKDALIDGVDTMLKIAVQLLSKKRRADSQPYLLPDSTGEDDATQDSEH